MLKNTFDGGNETAEYRMQLDPSAVGGVLAPDQSVPPTPVAPVAVHPAATAS